MRFNNLAGQRFDRLVVLERGENSSTGTVRWLCRCDCGTEKVVLAASLRSGVTRSCGCLHREAIKRPRPHAQLRHPLYRVWSAMLARCINSRRREYPDYGGRGIQVCDEWLPKNGGFPQFLADVGERPPDPSGWQSRKAYWSIDRIDVNGDYEPGNVRWATPKEQKANQRPKVYAVELVSARARIAELEAELAALRRGEEVA